MSFVFLLGGETSFGFQRAGGEGPKWFLNLNLPFKMGHHPYLLGATTNFDGQFFRVEPPFGSLGQRKGSKLFEFEANPKARGCVLFYQKVKRFYFWFSKKARNKKGAPLKTDTPQEAMISRCLSSFTLNSFWFGSA